MHRSIDRVTTILILNSLLINYFILNIKSVQDVEIFVAAAERGGLVRRSAAAWPIACRHQRRLEAADVSLGVALFVRTTRSMRLTIEGERLLARARPVVDRLRAAENEAVAGRAIVEGQVYLSRLSDLGWHTVLEWLSDFQQKHPGVQLRLQLSDRLANIYREPVNIAIRFGKLPDSSMVALPLITGRR
jgi:DNA-binding transcriptional LysR family regulator